jgi:hypothetical protein
MDETPPAPPAPAATVSPASAEWLRTQRNGGAWFFWIAGLSLMNTIAITSGAIMRPGARFGLVVGLGTTAVSDGLFYAQLYRPMLAYGIDAVVLSLFVALGFFARKGMLWPFILGLVLYGLDALIYVFLFGQPQLLYIGFHVFVLFRIWRGVQAARNLKHAAA